MDHYKTFPPRWSHIRVPLSSRAAARAAVGLYAPCTPKGYAVQRVAWAAVSIFGARALQGPTVGWQPPLSPSAWQSMLDAWGGLVGPHDAVAIYQRPQQVRGGFALLLLRAGVPLAFVRVRRSGPDGFSAERRALEALESARISSFWHPRVIGTARVDGWQALLTTAMRPAPHRPVKQPDLAAITADIRRALGPALPPAESSPPHWEPMHGDLTPWNVRQVHHSVVILDWEDVGWGPPQADATLYWAAVTALRGDEPPGVLPAEAVDFWRQRLADRPADPLDDDLSRGLAKTLERWATRA